MSCECIEMARAVMINSHHITADNITADTSHYKTLSQLTSQHRTFTVALGCIFVTRQELPHVALLCRDSSVGFSNSSL